ncbi:MAG TPA: GTP cyclohydrolase II RibA [Candidatus Saccharimonadales bacterium]
MDTISTILETTYGNFNLTYHNYEEYEGVSLSMGDVTAGTPLVRIHSSCLFSEALCAIDCDCKLQLNQALERISQEGVGILVYLYQEGRGVGLAKKIRAVEIMRKDNCDTAAAFEKLGFELDPRSYELALKALNDMKVAKTIRLMSNNPRKSRALETAGYEVIEHVALSYEANSTVHTYLKSKEAKLGHKIQWSAIKAQVGAK